MADLLNVSVIGRFDDIYAVIKDIKRLDVYVSTELGDGEEHEYIRLDNVVEVLQRHVTTEVERGNRPTESTEIHIPLSVIDDIKAEIKSYQNDCTVSCLGDWADKCAQCNANMFGSIYRIIDRHVKGEVRV